MKNLTWEQLLKYKPRGCFCQDRKYRNMKIDASLSDAGGTLVFTADSTDAFHLEFGTLMLVRYFRNGEGLDLIRGAQTMNFYIQYWNSSFTSGVNICQEIEELPQLLKLVPEKLISQFLDQKVLDFSRPSFMPRINEDIGTSSEVAIRGLEELKRMFLL